jgi:serine/threonine protein kinase/DNA-binding winged helix-turn-helix (wHTH) protein
MPVHTTEQRTVSFGPYVVDLTSHEILHEGHRVTLQEKPFQILAILLEQPGQLVTREELRNRLWPADTFVDFEHSINTAVKKVREALHDSGEHPKFVETLPRRGYRFIAPAEISSSAPGILCAPSQAAAETPKPGDPAVPEPVRSSRRPASECRPGVVLGHYRVLEKIGAGGAGEVFRAHDQHLDRDVAIKVLPPGTLADESARQRFQNEALALSKLSHPNIATIHDFDTQSDLDFLVMEYIPGITLSEKLQAGPLPEKKVVALGIQLVEGIAVAHEHGVIHRDLKPGNLRLTDDGRLKILDFGMAKLRMAVSPEATTASLTETQSISGTLPYMAPEQLCGGVIDARTDIHGAGMVLYEMATGHPPFALEERSQLIAAILHLAPRPLTAQNTAVSVELDRIVLKCLEKEPEDRYQSARELAIDLQRLHRDTYSSSSKTVAPERRSRSASTRYATWAAASILCASIGITASLWYRHSRPSMPARAALASIAVLPFTDLSSDHDRQYFSEGLAEEILNHLTKIPNLRVTARSSAFQFKGSEEDLRAVGRKLEVANILEGSVQRDQNRVRVTARLIKADDGFDLWSESFDRDLKDVFAVEDDIAKAVTSALQLKLLASRSPAALSSTGTTNPEAYESFLHARYFAHMQDAASTKKALHYADRAIASDPNYAPAYALRARIELAAGGMTWMDLSDATARTRHDTEKAIALDPNLADGYRVLSMIQSWVELNCPEAQTSLKRAIDLAPGDPDNLGLSAWLTMCLGRPQEAVQLWKQELLLDPLRVDEYLFLAQALRDLGRYDESNAALAKAVDLNPNRIEMIHEIGGEVYLAQGHPQQALAEFEAEPAGLYYDLGVALGYHALGRQKDSDAALGRMLSQHSANGAYQIAQVYGYRQEVDLAFQWLDRAYMQRDPGLMWIKTDLKLQSLRKDPRYAALLSKMNLQ